MCAYMFQTVIIYSVHWESQKKTMKKINYEIFYYKHFEWIGDQWEQNKNLQKLQVFGIISTR